MDGSGTAVGIGTREEAGVNKDPLHGQSLEKILLALVDYYGWEELGRRIDIKCFNIDPSIKSSLTFLRKTPWARSKVEELFIDMPD